MTRTLLEACRHRIANDDMALGREPSAALAQIDAALAGAKAVEGVGMTWCPERMAVLFRFADKNDGPWDDVGDQRKDLPCESEAHLAAAAPAMLAALKPFARTADDYGDDDPDDTKVDDLGVCDITLGHCRAARAAYRKAKGGGA